MSISRNKSEALLVSKLFFAEEKASETVASLTPAEVSEIPVASTLYENFKQLLFNFMDKERLPIDTAVNRIVKFLEASPDSYSLKSWFVTKLFATPKTLESVGTEINNEVELDSSMMGTRQCHKTNTEEIFNYGDILKRVYSFEKTFSNQISDKLSYSGLVDKVPDMQNIIDVINAIMSESRLSVGFVFDNIIKFLNNQSSFIPFSQEQVTQLGKVETDSKLVELLLAPTIIKFNTSLANVSLTGKMQDLVYMQDDYKQQCMRIEYCDNNLQKLFPQLMLNIYFNTDSLKREKANNLLGYYEQILSLHEANCDYSRRSVYQEQPVFEGFEPDGIIEPLYNSITGYFNQCVVTHAASFIYFLNDNSRLRSLAISSFDESVRSNSTYNEGLSDVSGEDSRDTPSAYFEILCLLSVSMVLILALGRQMMRGRNRFFSSLEPVVEDESDLLIRRLSF